MGKKRLERDPLHQGLIEERTKLKSREFLLNLDSRLGKMQVIGNTTTLSHQAGYYCSVCECILKDSATYLDHINGKWHQRALGMSMRVEKVGVERVRSRIDFYKNKRIEADAYKGKSSAELYQKCHMQYYLEKEKYQVNNKKKIEKKINENQKNYKAIAKVMGW